jgi:UDP-glucose:glycoprotein glucosyltransferase
LFSETDKVKYEVLLELAGKYLSPAQISILKFSLGLHVYSPKIEMFQQIAHGHGIPRDCDTFVDINDQVTCNPEDIQSLLSGASRYSMANFK